MALLTVIVLAQLAVSVLILSQLTRLADHRDHQRLSAEQDVRRRQAQTIRDLMEAEAAATAQPPSGRAEHAAGARSSA